MFRLVGKVLAWLRLPRRETVTEEIEKRLQGIQKSMKNIRHQSDGEPFATTSSRFRLRAIRVVHRRRRLSTARMTNGNRIILSRSSTFWVYVQVSKVEKSQREFLCQFQSSRQQRSHQIDSLGHEAMESYLAHIQIFGRSIPYVQPCHQGLDKLLRKLLQIGPLLDLPALWSYSRLVGIKEIQKTEKTQSAGVSMGTANLKTSSVALCPLPTLAVCGWAIGAGWVERFMSGSRRARGWNSLVPLKEEVRICTRHSGTYVLPQFPLSSGQYLEIG